jgi:AcrR family transcriptional regulator
MTEMTLELPVAGATPPPERGDAQRNRARVMEAAERLLCADGDLANVDMRVIAEEAGVGVGTIYRRFGDKATLVGNLLDRHARTLQEAVLEGPPPLGPGAPPEERLHAFLDGLIDHTEVACVVLQTLERIRSGARLEIGPYPAWRLHVKVLLDQIGGIEDTTWTAEALLAPLEPMLYRHQRRDQGRSVEEIKRNMARHARAIYGSRE